MDNDTLVFPGIYEFFQASVANRSILGRSYVERIFRNLQSQVLFLAENFFTLDTFIFIVALLALLTLLKFIFRPLNRIKTLSDIGWSFLVKEKVKNRTLTEAIAQVQRLRKIGNLPPVFPNGWFALTESREIAKGEVKSIVALGETFAVFRSIDGKVHILDAYCPHLGANLGVGGVVKGSCLECPFHGWQFEGSDGKCTKIPYAEKVPGAIKVKRWESNEINGSIFVWYDAEGRPPQYEIPAIEEINNGSWSYRGRTKHEVLSHIQEIPENGPDLPHLSHLHVPNILKGSDLEEIFKSAKVKDVACHHWQGIWEPLEAPHSHIAQLKVKHSWSLFGGRFKILSTHVTVQQIGPSIVHLHFDTLAGKGVFVQTVTPIEPLRQRLTHCFYSASTFITPIAKMVMNIEAGHVERDIMVWNSKQFLSKPFLVKEDKLIMKFRRWYSQFYSENSPTFKEYQKNSLDW